MSGRNAAAGECTCRPDDWRTTETCPEHAESCTECGRQLEEEDRDRGCSPMCTRCTVAELRADDDHDARF